MAIGRHRPDVSGDAVGRTVVMATEMVHERLETLNERLIRAADEELAEHGSLTGRFEAVAHRAGVSRATAYRQMGSVSELLKQVGLRRAVSYLEGLREVMDRESEPIAKLEAAFLYGAEFLPNEPIVLRLISRQFTSGRDPEVYEMINDVTMPTLVAGQREGQIRTDIDLSMVVDYIVEQSFLSTRAADKSTRALRERFRLFVVPAIGAGAAGRCRGSE